MSDQETVTLGAHEVIVYPQRHAYLTNKLTKFVEGMANDNLEFNTPSDFVALLGDGSYDLLAILIPQYGKRCPKYEFRGFSSQGACDAGDYNEDDDHSPTYPEIINAFEVSARIQRFDTFKVLGKVFDPKLIRTWINAKMAETLTNSASLPSARDGAGPLTNSGASSPTSTVSTDSQSQDSPRSKQPTASVPQQTVSS